MPWSSVSKASATCITTHCQADVVEPAYEAVTLSSADVRATPIGRTSDHNADIGTVGSLTGFGLPRFLRTSTARAGLARHGLVAVCSSPAAIGERAAGEDADYDSEDQPQAPAKHCVCAISVCVLTLLVVAIVIMIESDSSGPVHFAHRIVDFVSSKAKAAEHKAAIELAGSIVGPVGSTNGAVGTIDGFGPARTRIFV